MTRPTPCQQCKSARDELRRLADARFVEIGGLRARVAELEAELDSCREDWAEERTGRQAAESELAQLRERVAKALEAAESVQGTYKHPDQLETAVFGAFERMVEALRGQ